MSGLLLPTSMSEALALLKNCAAAKLIAGGTDLLVRLRHAQQAQDMTLVSLDRVAELRGIHAAEDGLSIGATTRFSEIATDPLVATHAPILASAAQTVGGPAIRNMATLGGNLCTASPAGDSLPPLYALGAEVELASIQGCRRLPLSQFVQGPGRTVLAQDEILARVILPWRPVFSRQHFEKVGRRQSLAIAVVSFTGLLRLDGKDRVEALHFAWGAVGPTVVTIPAVESLLQGQKLTLPLAQQAAALVRKSVQPISDVRASADYRRLLAGNLLQRFLLQAPTSCAHG